MGTGGLRHVRRVRRAPLRPVHLHQARRPSRGGALTAMAQAISVEHVSKRFRLYNERNQSLKAAIMRGGRARYEEFQALDDVSIDVDAGETFGFIGENGSGKSTLLKCIARILRPDSGEVTVEGKVSALL